MVVYGQHDSVSLKGSEVVKNIIIQVFKCILYNNFTEKKNNGGGETFIVNNMVLFYYLFIYLNFLYTG